MNWSSANPGTVGLMKRIKFRGHGPTLLSASTDEPWGLNSEGHNLACYQYMKKLNTHFLQNLEMNQKAQPLLGCHIKSNMKIP